MEMQEVGLGKYCLHAKNALESTVITPEEFDEKRGRKPVG